MNKLVRAIEVNSLTKSFDIYLSPLDLVSDLVFKTKRHQTFTALNDVTFHVNHGEAVAIMGHNGAGKSTLLKILTGTLDKTSGSVHTSGRISAILELGTGFHGDYSGRENIYMGGLCLGMTKKEVDAKINWIINFSELAEFIDRPFRTYSTGMQARLSFSTAISVDPDILIVDEALSVGDARFQRKCFRRIEELKTAGRTILFVSHDPRPVSAFCDRAILLDHGKIAADDSPKNILKLYNQILFGIASTAQLPLELKSTELPSPSKQHSDETTKLEVLPGELRAGTQNAEIIEVFLLDQEGRSLKYFDTLGRCTVCFRVKVIKAIDAIQFGFRFTNVHGTEIYGTNTPLLGVSIDSPIAGAIYDVKFFVVLAIAPGRYFLTVSAASPDGEMYDRRADIVDFEVAGNFKGYTTSICNLDAQAMITATPPRGPSVLEGAAIDTK